MYIKQITICGFKSYKDKVVINDFFNGLNVIVGRNGSGKSNIFAAIEFALTLEYRYMKPESRSALLFQGRSQQDAAFVEVVFDNTDRKLPVAENTVTFRRVLGVKKDKFFVNGKEILNAKQFLDIAGFTNPYFIVKQGKILDLALATDATRLKIISDVLGTSIYDNKILECKRSIEGADAKKQDIEDKVNDLEERMKALESEVLEQRKYMKQDQAKRAIEYVLHEREHQRIQHNIAEAETRRNKFNLDQKPLRVNSEKNLRIQQILKREIGDIDLKIGQLQELRNDHEIQRNEITAILACQQQELNDLMSTGTQTSQHDKGFSKKKDQLEKDISKTKEILTRTEAELTKLKEPLIMLETEICQLDVRKNEITAKECRKGAFKNAAEYRRHLENKLKDVRSRVTDTTDALTRMQASCDKSIENLNEAITEHEESQKKLSDSGSDLSILNHKVEKSRTQLFEIKNALETKWRELNETERELSQQKERIARLDEEFRKCYGAAILAGQKGVACILEQLRTENRHPEVLEGYLGLVCENIRCKSELDLAVESAGGKKLLHHIVQSPAIAEIILKEFNARKLRGEVNFIPLEGLRVPNLDHVPSDLRMAKPMISAIQFDDRVSDVSKFVFGRTLLCDSLETAIDVMSKYKVEGVTLEGERVSKVGTISGGYIRRGPQKLELQRAKCIEERNLAEIFEKKSKLDEETNNINQQYRTVKQKHEQLSLQKSHEETRKRNTMTDIRTAEKKISTRKEHIQSLQRNISDRRSNISALEERERMLNSELKGEQSLNEAETMAQFRDANIRFGEAKKKVTTKQSEKRDLEAKVHHLHKLYYKHLSSEAEKDQTLNEAEMTSIQNNIKSLSKQVAELEAKIQNTHREVVELENVITGKQKQLDDLREAEMKVSDQLLGNLTNLEALAAKYLHWQNKLQDHKAAAGKLGSIPLNLEKYEELEDKELLHKLKKINAKLKNKIEINQKAVQQFEELKEKCQCFRNRLNSYGEEQKEILGLLKDIENKKGETLLNNIRLIQEQFRSIFCSIVNDGDAELLLYGNSISINQDIDIDSDKLREMAGQNMFDGVRVSVNFVGKQLQSNRGLAQLSGGQKSIVALCIILAIQTVDPVPFYLFDEVDQALDATYRTSVAKVIANMSEKSQFICTTFRKEFVTVADKVFGISFQNKCSHVQAISETQALDFVETDVSSSTPIGSFSPDHSVA